MDAAWNLQAAYDFAKPFRQKMGDKTVGDDTPIEAA